MSLKSFRLKIILPVTILFLLLIVVLIAFLSLRFNTFANSMQSNLMFANLVSLQHVLDVGANNTYAATLALEHDPDLIEAIQSNDRDAIYRRLSGVTYDFGIDFFVLTDIVGNVILRTNDPTKYGDSIANQASIKNAINGRVSTYAEESDCIKVSIRTGGPIRDTNGTIIALLSSGVRFDSQEAVSDIKKIINSEVTVFYGNSRIASTITLDGQSVDGTVLEDNIYEQVFNKKQIYTSLVHIGTHGFNASYIPIKNVDGEVFAAIATSASNTPFNEVIASFVTYGVIIGLSMLLIATFILVLIISSISRPLLIITKQMDQFSNGNLDIMIEIKSKDEVGRLGTALKKSTQTIKRLMETIENMINDQKSGYTNFYLESSEFQGVYRRIAANILELTGFSMYDQLTKIPNRRTFDNRLFLEWSHAERDHNPISIMMIDIDFFKRYNDSFGHQQGDVALITVASVLKDSLKRKIDFVARWGGEEFVVLLPNTTLEGALKVGERIRIQVQEAVIPAEVPEAHHVTISIGVYTQCVYENTYTDQFIHQVDAALYKAKESGRNCVRYSEP